jgi:hypothetical protein
MSGVQAENLPAVRFYIDCEFNGHGGELLSMALVCEDGRSLYLAIPYEPLNLDPWVAKNVWPLVHTYGRAIAIPVKQWGHLIRVFIGGADHPIIIADSPVDIGRFCTVLSTGDDGGWASADYPKITFEVHNVDCYPTDLPGAVQHNAYWDAMALRHKLGGCATEAR